jgi:hypothetical protein
LPVTGDFQANNPDPGDFRVGLPIAGSFQANLSDFPNPGGYQASQPGWPVVGDF